jgi:cytoskeletal protein CcmA (bactofilin family)
MNTITSNSKKSIISRNAKIEGEIKGSEDIVVEGSIKGTIQLNGDVLVENSGVVEANVEANNIVIKGKVIGTVTAREMLAIESSGKLFGDFSSSSVNIKEGALIEGHSHMITSANKAESH